MNHEYDLCMKSIARMDEPTENLPQLCNAVLVLRLTIYYFSSLSCEKAAKTPK